MIPDGYVRLLEEVFQLAETLAPDRAAAEALEAARAIFRQRLEGGLWSAGVERPWPDGGFLLFGAETWRTDAGYAVLETGRDADGREVWIRQATDVWPDGRERLNPPDDWPKLIPPTLGGEPAAAYLDRAIFGHRVVRDILALGARIQGGLKLPSLDGIRPAERTLEWWWEKCPHKDFYSTYGETRREALQYHLERIVWRLVVELADRLKAGDFVMRADREDAACPQDKVDPNWWRNHYMVLRPRAPGGGSFGPEQLRGVMPPGLPWFRNLTLWPAETVGAAETPALVPEPRLEGPETPTPEPPPPVAPPPDPFKDCVECLRTIAAASPGYRTHTRPQLKLLCKGKLGEEAWREALREAFPEGSAWRDTGKRGKP